jgi:hypothetical protein
MAPYVTIAMLRRLLTSRQQAEPAWRATARADVLRELGGPGCTVCRGRSGAERQWMASFIHETNADPGVRAALRASRGFCPAHLRLAHEQTEAPFVLTIVQEEVAAERIADLVSRGRRPSGGCPVCAAAAAGETGRLTLIATLFGEAEIRDALRGGDGLCSPHWAALGAAVPATALARLVELAAGALAGPALPPVPLLAGDDPDLPRRAGLLTAAVAAHAAWAPEVVAGQATARIRAESAGGCCALCRAATFGAIGYLRWLADLGDSDRLRLEPPEYALCGTHLGDLSVIGPAAAGWIAADHLAAARDACAGAAAVLDGAGPRRDAADEALRRITSRRACPACHASVTAVDRTAALLAAGLHDESMRAGFAAGHGVCAEHARELTSQSGSPLPADVLRARLELLRWELAEAARRRGWRTRHEPRGPEGTAWRRAPTLLCGAAYLGLPEPPGEAR